MFKNNVSPDALSPQTGIKCYFVMQKERFNALGIDITSMEKTIFNPFLLWIPLISLIMFDIFMLISIIEHRHNVNVMTDTLCFFCQSSLSMIKVLCFKWNEKKFVKLVRRIWMWNLEARDEELQILVEENKKDRLLGLLFYRWVITTASMAFIIPFIVAIYYYNYCALEGHEFIDFLELPFKAAYHLVVDPKSYKGYVLAYLWNFIAVYCVFNGALSNDTLFSWVAHNVSAQFRILNLRFKTIGHNLEQHCNDDRILRSLKQTIEHHHRVIDLVNDFDEVFKVIVFFKYTINYSQIACLVFQIAQGGELLAVVFYVLFLISASLQLLLYCQGGQKIIDESTSVVSAIYVLIPWYKVSFKVRKFLTIPMIRAQRPCIITGVFFVANLQQFVWVFKTAGSFFTMLMSLETKGKSV